MNETTKTYATDNRWSPGCTHVIPPRHTAAYSARWIDDGATAGILGDRQGFAYDTAEQRNALVDLLEDAHVHRDLSKVDRDAIVQVVNTATWSMWLRRAGGYVYAEAWLHG